MVERTLSNMIITEYTLYEASKCLRRSFLFSKNTVYNLFQGTEKIKKRTLVYIPYEDSLKYSILKKIYYFSVDYLLKEKKLSFEIFKKFSLEIIEKEINSNKKKVIKLELKESNYNKIRKEIILELDKHFLLINPYDFENNIYNFLVLNIDVKQLIENSLNTLREEIANKIVKIDFKGVPTLKLEVLGIEKLNDFSFNIIITSIFNLKEELLHNSYLIYIYFSYFKSLIKKNFFKDDKFNNNLYINEVIVYNPLTLKRTAIDIKKISGSFSLNEFIKLIKIYNEGLDFKNLNKKNCYFCENLHICSNKNITMSKIKTILLKIDKNT